MDFILSGGAGAGSGTSIQFAVLNDTKAANAQSGTFTSGAWRTRTINTTQSDDGSITSLSSSQITLQAGTYYIYATCPAYNVARHKARLQNITDGTTAIVGSSDYTSQGVTDSTTNSSIVTGVFTIADAKVFELQHQCQTTKLNQGFGVESNFGISEVYAQIMIMKIG